MRVGRNPQDSPEILTPKASQKKLPELTSAIQLTFDKEKLQGADHTFTLHLQHTGTTSVTVDNYTLELTLVEKGGNGTTLAYTSAGNNPQSTAAIQEKLTHFTIKKELTSTDLALDIPFTLHPAIGVKEVTAVINLISADGTQTSRVVWELFTPALITNPMIQAAASNKALSGLLQKLKDGIQLTPDEKNQALLQAAILGDPETFKALWQVSEMDVNAQSNTGDTPLSLAVSNGHEALVKLLLAAKADVNKIDSSNLKRTPLHYAVDYGNETIVNLLLDEQASVDPQDESGRTPLHYAQIILLTNTI